MPDLGWGMFQAAYLPSTLDGLQAPVTTTVEARTELPLGPGAPLSPDNCARTPNLSSSHIRVSNYLVAVKPLGEMIVLVLFVSLF